MKKKKNALIKNFIVRELMYMCSWFLLKWCNISVFKLFRIINNNKLNLLFLFFFFLILRYEKVMGNWYRSMVRFLVNENNFGLSFYLWKNLLITSWIT